jgi:hypothetical protein
MENDEIKVFKDKLLHYINQIGDISFDVFLHHKGHHVELPDLGEFKNELEEWIAYSGLAEYLVSKDIYYTFSGTLYLDGDEIMVSVQFSGPYDEEFENTLIEIDNSTLAQIIGDDVLKQPLDDFNPDEFFIQFEYDQDQGFLGFSADYYVENRFIDFQDIFVDQQIERLKSLCEQHVLSNVPTLDVPSDLPQYWSASCDQGSVSYSISTGALILRFDDI